MPLAAKRSYELPGGIASREAGLRGNRGAIRKPPAPFEKASLSAFGPAEHARDQKTVGRVK